MSFLFDTDAISEVWRRRPSPAYLAWLATIPLEQQYTSAITVGELYKGAFRSQTPERFLAHIEEQLLPNVTVLPYDAAVARVCGQIRADLERQGQILEDADLQIAATAIHHDLELVTGNIVHYQRLEALRLNRALVEARKD